MRTLTRQEVLTFLSSISGRIQGRKLQLLCYGLLALVSALLVSLIFGETYEGSVGPLRGKARKTRETYSSSSHQSSTNDRLFKDPFANRPRIRTRNGHLVIEASQDKNIDFRTSGSVGSVTINGVKLDKLLSVTRALERTASNATLSSSSTGEQVDQLEWLLRSGSRVSALEKKVEQLTRDKNEQARQMTAMVRILKRKNQQLSRLSEQVDLLVEKSGLSNKDIATNCSARLIQDSGYIRTPNFPFSYPPKSVCIWYIQARPRQQIRLNFTSFDLEGSIWSLFCVHDFLEIRNGPDESSPLMGRFCGHQLQSRVLISQSNLLMLRFVSDGGDSRTGFEVHFDGAQNGCGGTLNSGSGQIESPNFPYSYPQSVECEWLIEVAQANRIQLTINQLDLKSCDFSSADDKLNNSLFKMDDYLAIYDSAGATTTTSSDDETSWSSSGPSSSVSSITKALVKLCKLPQNKPLTIPISTSNKLFIVFKAQKLGMRRGFQLSYRSVCDKIELVGFRGSIESPGYPSGYEPNTECSWLIKSPLGSNLTIALTDLQLSYDESRIGLDNLVISSNVTTKSSKTSANKNSDSSSTQVRVFTGELDSYNESSRLVELNSNLARVLFTSHRVHEIPARGFRLEWQAQGCGGSQFYGDTIQRLIYHETDSSSPVECLWIYDLSKSANSIDFSIQSDMRVPGVSPSSDSSALTERNFLCDDASLTVYDGLTDKAPILFRNCDSLRNRNAIHSSSAQTLVKFYSSSKHANYGRWFSLIGWATNRDNCLTSNYDINSPFNQIAGEKKSPNYPELYERASGRCFAMLNTQSGRLRIRVEDLDIPVSLASGKANNTLLAGKVDKEVCRQSENYLVVKDLVGKRVEELFCGKINSNSSGSELVMEQEAAWIEFHSSKSGYRGRWKLTYARLCGSLVYIDVPRTFSTANYPNAPAWSRVDSNQAKAENVCLWRLKTQLTSEQTTSNSDIKSTRADHKLHLNIINFVESTRNNKTDCLRVYEGAEVLSLKQSSFNITDIDLKLEPKIKICSLKDVKHSALQYVSQGSELTLMVSGEARVKFRVKVFENFCGGEYHHNEAEFATLGYPQAYGSNLDCHYFIVGSPGSLIKLKFLTFDLYDEPDELSDSYESVPITDEIDGFNSTTLNLIPSPKSCDNSDYVEIRQLSARDKINLKRSQLKIMYKWTQGALLVSDTPETLFSNSSSNSSSSSSSTSSGNWTNLSSAQQSEKGGKAANLLVDLIRTTRLFQESSSKYNSYLGKQLVSLDDFYENSRLIGRFCGKIVPDLSGINLRDEVLVRFRSHGMKTDTGSTSTSAASKVSTSRGFLAEYKISYGGFISMLDEESKAGGYISSPTFPTKVRFNNSIRWEFQTLEDSVIKFQLINMDLDSIHENCQDSISIFDGFSSTSSLMQRLCGHLSFKSWEADRKLGIPKSNHIFKLLPIYLAHDPKVQAGLIKSYQTTSNVASVVYENFKSEGMFLLRYKAVNKSSVVESEPQIKNEYWPPSGTGGEIVNIVEQSDYDDQTSGKQQQLLSCSSTNLLSSDSKHNSSQIILSSPNWPKEPPRNIECHWLVYTRENSNIQLSVAPTTLDDANSANVYITSDSDQPNYDRKPDACLDPNNNEKRNFIAIHDGASRLAPILARYCLPVPPIQFQSTGRHMLIRYVHSEPEKSASEASVSLRRSLFKARASVAQCGGQYHILTSSRIYDRVQGKSKNYGNNLNCMYYLFASGPDKVITIHDEMSDFDLSGEPTNQDCSVGDYIEIRDLPIQTDLMDYSRASTGRLLGRFCSGHKLVYLETPGSGISIKFKTDSENTAAGWQLYVMSSTPRLSCPRGYSSINLEEPFGRIASPHWPLGFYGKRRCRYQLIANANQSIELTFLRLNRPKLDGLCQDSLIYLADNEASILRYDSRPLQELQSSLSGTLMRKLIKKLPCQSPGSKDLPQDNKTTLNYMGYESVGFKKLSAEEYFLFKEMASPQALELKTQSHLLLIEYETSNLQENQGFFAIVRVAENTKNQECGGDIYYRSSASANNSKSTKKSNNLIKSARFGEETSESDPFIQCDWVLHNEATAYEYLDLHQTVAYNLVPSSKVGEFKTVYLVFNTLEIPPAIPDSAVMESWTNERSNKLNEMCALNRLIVSDYYFMTSTFACGNITTNKWLLLDYNIRRLSLRTKNLRRKSNTPSGGVSKQGTRASFYSGVLAYFYEKSCVQIERLVGQGVRFRSHLNYTNSRYSPGICKWDLLLTGGDYELWFESINLRPLPGYNSTGKNVSSCDTNDTNLDYIELRASAEGDSPVITRYCFANQLINKQKALMLSSRIEMTIVFVAGLKQLSNGFEEFSPSDLVNSSDIYGFDMILMKKRNESEGEFCRRDSQQNIYSFIRSKDKEYYDSTFSPLRLSSFLYPKNTHCIVELSLDSGMRFNVSFKGFFDLESSYNCMNDYVQIDELYAKTDSTNTTLPTTDIKGLNDTTVTLINHRVLIPKLVGKWCGRNKPEGFFLPNTEKIRITFHSNDFVEGKGFLIEYSTYSSLNMTTAVTPATELIPLILI